MCFDVEQGIKTAAGVAWEAAAEISLLVQTFWRYICSTGGVAAAFIIAAAPGLL